MSGNLSAAECETATASVECWGLVAQNDFPWSEPGPYFLGAPLDVVPIWCDGWSQSLAKCKWIMKHILSGEPADWLFERRCSCRQHVMTGSTQLSQGHKQLFSLLVLGDGSFPFAGNNYMIIYVWFFFKWKSMSNWEICPICTWRIELASQATAAAKNPKVIPKNCKSFLLWVINALTLLEYREFGTEPQWWDQLWNRQAIAGPRHIDKLCFR